MSIDKIFKHSLTKVLVYANVWIALCAFAQVLFTQLLFKIPIDYNGISYLVMVGLSTYLQYNLQRGYMIDQQNVYTDRSQWLLKNKKLMLISNGLALLIILFLCWSLSWTSIYIMVGAEVISMLYFMPPFNLRKYGYFKPFLISAIWVISCIVVPLIENKLIAAEVSGAWYFVIAQFLFISVLCLLFDINDAESDKRNGVNTYANRFGINITKAIGIVLLFAASLAVHYAFKNKQQIITYVAFMLLSIILVLMTKKGRHAFYFYLLIDGLLIMQPISFIWLY